MPPRIPVETVKRFDALLAAGHNVMDASRQCGVSKDWAYNRSKGRRKKNQAKFYETLADAELPPPTPTSRLSADAQRALEDFDFFRRRFTGRASMPWQVEAANQILALIESPQKEFVVINCPPGAGKALALDTPIPTPGGWTTMKDLAVGDEVFDEHGKPVRVLAKSDVFYGHDCYEVRTDDGASVIADAEHLWSVRLHGHGQYGQWKVKEGYAGKTGPKPSPDGRHVHTTEFLARPRNKRPQLQVADPLELPARHLPIDPYVLGVWLGDGTSAQANLTCHEDDAPFIVEQIEQAGYAVEFKGGMRYSITGSRRWQRDGLRTHLRLAGLLNNKHIPDVYFRASADQRLALLQGLVDTDGHVDAKGRVEFTSTNRNLADGVRALAHSLGVKASLSTGRATIAGRDCGEKYRVGFQHPQAARLPRKAERCRAGVRTPSRYLTVTKVESVPTQCIVVDSDSHLFLAGEGLMVTHNSTLFVHDIPLWLICRNRAIRILIGSRTERQAKGYTGRLMDSLERSSPYLATDTEKAQGTIDAASTVTADYGRFKPTTPKVWRREELTVAQPNDVAASDKENTLSAYGKDGGILGGRFDLSLWDDLVDPKNQGTPEAREDLKKWWKEIAMTRCEPGGAVVLQGQRIGPDDLYRFALDLTDVVLDEDGYRIEQADPPKKFKHIIYKAHYEDKCTGAHPNRTPAWPEGCLLDPFRLTWRDLESTRDAGAESFLTGYQQEDVDPATVLVQKVWVVGGRDERGVEYPGCWDNERGMCELPRNIEGDLFSYVTVDPSPANWWAAQWWIFHPESQQRFLMDLIRAKISGSDLVDYDIDARELIGFMPEWQARSVKLGWPIRYWIIESNAAQKWLAGNAAGNRFLRTYDAQIVRHNTGLNKVDASLGVSMLSTVYRQGRVRLPGKQDDGSRLASLKLVDEVTRYPHAGTDDQVMAQWFGEWNLDRLYTPADMPAPPSARRLGQRATRIGTGRMTITAEQIVSLYRSRKAEMDPINAKRLMVRDAYNGDLRVSLPDMGREVQASVANLLNTGLDQLAMRVSSTLPSIYCPPRDESVKREVTAAEKRQQALYGWWEANDLDALVPIRARQMLAYAASPVMLWPNYKLGIATWRMRDPFGTFPSACMNPGDITPADCVFAYRQTYGYLLSTYPDKMERLYRKEKPSRDARLILLDYVDDEELVTVVLSEAGLDDRNPYGVTSGVGTGFLGSAPHVELERITNKAGICTVVIPGRITLDRALGQFDQMIGLYATQAKLAALELIAVEKGIFPDTYLESRPGEQAKFITGPHDGRTGMVNIVQGGVVREVGTNPGFQTNPTIDRLERASRLAGGIPAEFGAESASNVRTGKRGDAILSAAVDYPVAEQQKVLARSMREENKRAIAIAKGYFGSRKQSFYVSWKGAAGQVDYVAKDIFTSDHNVVTYSHVGSDLNGLTIMVGQLVGMNAMSRQTAMELLPIIRNPEQEHDRSIKESLETALLAGVQQKVNDGTIAPVDAAWLMQQVGNNKLELAEAIIKLDERVQRRQAEAQAQTADPALANPMAGLATGTAAEAQVIPPSIGEPPEAQQNLSSLLGSLRMPQMTLPAERPAVA